jgi:two-component sensor histidine kinase
MKLLLAVILFLVIPFSQLFAQKEQATFDNIIKMPNDTVKVDSLSNFGADIEFINGKVGLRCQQEALKIAQKLGDKKRIANAYYLMGCEEQILEKYGESLQHLQIAYKFFEELKMYKKLIKSTLKMGQLFSSKLDPNSSIKYYQKTLFLARKYNYEEYQAYALTSIASIQGYELNDYKNSLENYKKGNEISQKLGMEQNLQSTNLNMAGIYKKIKQYDKALKMLEGVLIYFKKKDSYDEYAQAMAIGKISEVFYEQKEYAKAEQKIKESLNLANQQNESLEMRVDYTDLLRKIYDAQNNIPAAYQTQKKWRVLYDTLTNQNARKTVATLQTQFETVQKEAQIKELDEQNHAQQTQLIWAISGFTVLLISLIGGFYLYRKLNQNKLKVEEQSLQLTTLMKELHHRVKNNLAIVSSLLSMQSNRLEDKNAAKAVREGQMRVQAMSLIHQRLYKTDDVSTVNIREYFTELAESLMQAYGYNPDDFELTIEVENPALDVDLAIPLGLIVNELITNSFKYAYEGIAHPSLNIYLKNDATITLKVQDNGIGIDEELVSQKSNSFGQKLIKGLSKQLKGDYKFENNQGTYFELNIPKIAA